MVNEITEKGCYFGHLSEIDDTLLDKLEKLSNLLDRNYYTKVTHSYLGSNNNKIESTLANSFEEAESIKNNWLSKKNNGLNVWQVFYTFDNENKKGTQLLQNSLETIKELFLPIIEYCYGKDIISEIWDINRNLINLTNFTEGCFIDNHSDGGSPNMVCNILIYLNKDWKEGDGGELCIKETYTQQPKWGNFAVLDFVKDNPSHLVTPIITPEINRFAVLTGVLLKENENGFI